jgi:adenine phosphoribosyltransferase
MRTRKQGSDARTHPRLISPPHRPHARPRPTTGAVISESYALEYGTDALELHVGAISEGQRVLLVDDLIATGGTLAAGARLVRRAGGVAVEACCIIELPELGVRACLRGCAALCGAMRAC